jgi:hypothetical protein
MKKMLAVLAALVALGVTGAPALGDPPGPGDKQCVPGQNNVGGGPGNSGTGDQNGAPLKAPPSCPGPDH